MRMSINAMLIRTATEQDVAYIVSLHRKLSEYLGLVPMATYSERLHHIKIAEENGDPVGFCYAGVNRGIVTVHQVGVQDDARRLKIGSALVSASEPDGALFTRCKVRDSVPDREFWPEIGFELTNVVPGGKRRGRDNLIYRRPLSSELIEVARCAVEQETRFGIGIGRKGVT